MQDCTTEHLIAGKNSVARLCSYDRLARTMANADERRFREGAAREIEARFLGILD